AVQAVAGGAGRNRSTRAGDGGEAGWNPAARLLPIERPTPLDHGTRRIAQIETHDVIAPPPSRCGVARTAADDIGDSGVAFPPTLVGPREVPDDRIACSHGTDRPRGARVGHVPD